MKNLRNKIYSSMIFSSLILSPMNSLKAETLIDTISRAFSYAVAEDPTKTISGGGAPISKPSISDDYTEEMLKPFLKNSENITEQSRIAKQYGVETWQKLRNIAESR